MFAYFDIINGLPKRGCVSDNDVYSPEGTLARLVTKTLWRIKRAAKARSLLSFGWQSIRLQAKEISTTMLYSCLLFTLSVVSELTKFRGIYNVAIFFLSTRTVCLFYMDRSAKASVQGGAHCLLYCCSQMDCPSSTLESIDNCSNGTETFGQ